MEVLIMGKYAQGFQEAVNDIAKGYTIQELRRYAMALKGEEKAGYMAGIAKASNL